MAKPVPSEGPWRSFSVSLREADLARLDEARGDLNRSEWARGILIGALDAPEPSPSRSTTHDLGGVPVTVTEDERVPPGAALLSTGADVAAVPVPAPRKRKATVVTTASELSKPPAERRAAVVPGVRYPCCKHCKRDHGGHGDPCMNGCHGEPG